MLYFCFLFLPFTSNSLSPHPPVIHSTNRRTASPDEHHLQPFFSFRPPFSHLTSLSFLNQRRCCLVYFDVRPPNQLASCRSSRHWACHRSSRTTFPPSREELGLIENPCRSPGAFCPHPLHVGALAPVLTRFMLTNLRRSALCRPFQKSKCPRDLIPLYLNCACVCMISRLLSPIFP